MPNELTYVCKETLPISAYVLNEDCESTLIHPSTVSISLQLCEQRMLTLGNIHWIPLHLSNEWLFVTSYDEIFTVLCGTMKYQFTLQGRGKLYLPPRCKGYSTQSTLYALSTITQNSTQEDVLPLASVNLDCCLSENEKEQLREIPLQEPLTHILSSIEDLSIASVKINEIQNLIKQEQQQRSAHFKLLSTTWSSVVLTDCYANSY